MESAAGKQARVARSRAACAGCRSTKQKCDGPSRIPCRRCELYGLACEYPQTPPTKPVVRTLSAAAAASSSSSSLPPSSSLSQPPPFFTANSADGAMNERLKEIVDRLRSIESSISTLNLNAGPSHSSPSGDSPDTLHHNHSDHASVSSPSHVSDDPSQILPLPGATVAGHALQSVSATIDFIESLEKSPTGGPNQPNGLVDFSAALGSTGSYTSTKPVSPGLETMLEGYTKPDAIDRGILSHAEVDATFKIFFRMLAPWVFFFDLDADPNYMEMRRRCPILFHIILTSTSYYLMGSSERGTQVYKALVAVTNEIFAPIIMSTQEYDLTSDLVRAIVLLILYKPVQFEAFHASGRVDTLERAEQFSKLNTTSSFTLAGILSRLTYRINLNNMPNLFAKLYSPTVAPAPRIMSDLRLYLWILCIDNHAALTTGRVPTYDVTDALRITRMFSGLKHQTGDVRLASMVELYAIARQSTSKPWFSDFTKRAPAYDLRKANRDIDEWEEYWTQPLEEAAAAGDALGLNPLNHVANLARAIINSSVFMRWQTERRALLAKGIDGRPEMSSDDWAALQHVLSAVERQIFSLSVESRVAGTHRRKVQWASEPFAIPKGGRPSLTLDQMMVDQHRTAFDPITCVAYVYPMLLVARMANAALVNCEMVVKDQNAYDSGHIALGRPQFLLAGAKFARLLELGSKFLDALAPTPSHPAKRHARILRAMFVVGTVSYSAAVSGPKRSTSNEQASNAPSANPETSPSTTRSSPVSMGSNGNAAVASTYSPVTPPLNFALPTQALKAGSDNDVLLNTTNFTTTQSELENAKATTSNEAGEMLRTLLQGINPNFFGEELTYGMNLGEAPHADDATMNMAVDWASLEKTLNSLDVVQSDPSPQVDYFALLSRGSNS